MTVKVHFDEAPEGQPVDYGRQVSQDTILDLQCAIIGALKILVTDMGEIADTMSRIEDAIIEGTETAKQGIKASEKQREGMDKIIEAAEKLVGALKGNESD